METVGEVLFSPSHDRIKEELQKGPIVAFVEIGDWVFVRKGCPFLEIWNKVGRHSNHIQYVL